MALLLSPGACDEFSAGSRVLVGCVGDVMCLVFGIGTVSFFFFHDLQTGTIGKDGVGTNESMGYGHCNGALYLG